MTFVEIVEVPGNGSNENGGIGLSDSLFGVKSEKNHGHWDQCTAPTQSSAIRNEEKYKSDDTADILNSEQI